MRQSQKAVFSLVLSIIVFSVFAYFSFSGFFEMLENDFFSKTKIKNIQDRLEGIEYSIDLFNSDHLQKLSSMMSQPYFAVVFSSSQTQEDIRGRENEIGRLRSTEPEMIRIRIIDKDLKRLHFSTDRGDIKNNIDGGIVYSNFDEVMNREPMDFSRFDKGSGFYQYDEDTQSILYGCPVGSDGNSAGGYAIMSLSSAAMERYLQKTEMLKFYEQLLLSDAGLVVGFHSGISGTSVLRELGGVVSQENPSIVYMANETGMRYVLISGRRVPQYFAFLVPESLLLLNPILKIILLVAFFITCFLLIYFVLNARHGPEIIIAERLQKLRTFFIDETLYANKDCTGEDLLKVLGRRKGELMKRLTRGLKFKNDEERFRIETKIEKVMEDIIFLSREKFESYNMVSVSQKKEIPHITASGKSVTINAIPKEESDADEKSSAGTSEIGTRSTIAGYAAEDREPEEVEELEEVEEVEELEAVYASEASTDTLLEPVNEADEPEELEELEEFDDAETDCGSSNLGIPPSAMDDDLEELCAADEEENDTGFVAEGSVAKPPLNSGLEKWKLPGTKMNFKDSGLPGIELEKIEGVGAIEITAESEDGLFSIDVNLLGSEKTEKAGKGAIGDSGIKDSEKR